jgi:hypothetical protein
LGRNQAELEAESSASMTSSPSLKPELKSDMGLQAFLFWPSKLLESPKAGNLSNGQHAGTELFEEALAHCLTRVGVSEIGNILTTPRSFSATAQIVNAL